MIRYHNYAQNFRQKSDKIEVITKCVNMGLAQATAFS